MPGMLGQIRFRLQVEQEGHMQSRQVLMTQLVRKELR